MEPWLQVAVFLHLNKQIKKSLQFSKILFVCIDIGSAPLWWRDLTCKLQQPVKKPSHSTWECDRLFTDKITWIYSMNCASKTVIYWEPPKLGFFQTGLISSWNIYQRYCQKNAMVVWIKSCLKEYCTHCTPITLSDSCRCKYQVLKSMQQNQNISSFLFHWLFFQVKAWNLHYPTMPLNCWQLSWRFECVML